MLCKCGCGGEVPAKKRPQGVTPQWIPSHRPGIRAARQRRICIDRTCEQCGQTFQTTKDQLARGWGRFCSHTCMYAWRKQQPRTGAPFLVRQLQPGEPIPAGVPRRYSNSRGYIRLRWKIGLKTYVEAYEHRIVAGVVTGDVHHINHDRADNRLENLQPVSRVEHAQLHGRERQKFSTEDATELYEQGFGLRIIARRFGVHTVTVMRRLKRHGVQMRPRQRNDLLQISHTVSYERVV